MACNKLYNYNLVTRDETDITATAENAFFPANNLHDYRTTKVFRTPDGTTTGIIDFDFKTAEPVDAIILVGNKFDGLGFASITVEANITADFSSPLFSTTVDIEQKFNFGFKDVSTTKPEFRFWRVTITGAAPFVELAHIFIGPELSIGRSINLNWSFQNNDLSSVTKNRHGQRFTDIRNQQKEIRIGFSKLSKTEYPLLQDAIDINGEHTPFWVVIDPEAEISDNMGRFAGPFFLERAPQIKNPFYARYDVNAMRLLEAI
jgi:hypothetical protein